MRVPDVRLKRWICHHQRGGLDDRVALSWLLSSNGIPPLSPLSHPCRCWLAMWLTAPWLPTCESAEEVPHLRLKCGIHHQPRGSQPRSRGAVYISSHHSQPRRFWLASWRWSGVRRDFRPPPCSGQRCCWLAT